MSRYNQLIIEVGEERAESFVQILATLLDIEARSEPWITDRTVIHLPEDLTAERYWEIRRLACTFTTAYRMGVWDEVRAAR